MSNLKENDALGGTGTVFHFGTSEVLNKRYSFIVVNEDAVFTTLEDIKGNDLKTLLNIESNTISKGMVIRALNGFKIANITLASGSICGIL